MIPKLKAQPQVIVQELLERGRTKQAKETTSQMLTHPLTFFVPTPEQEKFINIVRDSNQDSNMPVILWMAANGVGKTTTSIVTMLNIILQTENPYFQGGVFTEPWTYPKKIWYCSTGEALQNRILPEVKRLLQYERYQSHKKNKPYISNIKIGDWEIDFKSYDQDRKTYESDNVGVIIPDEPAPENIWKALKGRRRMGCITMMVMTPLFTPPYVSDEVKDAIDKGEKGYFSLKSDIWSTSKEDPRGYLNPKDIEDLIKGYSADERDARAYGDLAYFSTRVYKDISEEMHRIGSYEEVLSDLPAGTQFKQIVDPHDGRPPAVIWMALLPNNRKIVLYEYPEDQSKRFWEFNKPIKMRDQVQDFIKIETMLNIHSPRRIIDKRFGFQRRAGKTIAGQYAKFGREYANKHYMTKNFIYLRSYDTKGLKDNELQFGHNKVIEALQPMDDGVPGLLFCSNCFHTWQGMTHYIRKHETTKGSEDKPAATGKLVEKYKDYPDVVRMGVCDQETRRRSQLDDKYIEARVIADNPLGGL